MLPGRAGGIRAGPLGKTRAGRAGGIRAGRAGGTVGTRRCVLAHDLGGRLVGAQALVGRLAQAAAPGPLAELHLCKQARLDKHGLARRAPAGREWRCAPLQRGEQVAQALELAVAEAAAHASDIAQPPVLVDTEQQRADPLGAFALAGHPAADHELLAAEALDLHPVSRAQAGLIDGVQALGHDPLETLLGAGRKQRRALPDDVLGRAPALAVQAQLAEPRAALTVGLLHQRVAVQPQQIEDHVGHGRVLGQAFGLGPGGHVHALLQGAEAWSPGGVEGDDLAVEDGAVRAERPPEASELRVAVGDLVEVAAVQVQPARLRVGDGADPVPLDLVGPVLLVGRQGPAAGEHRHEPLRHRFAVWVRRRIHAMDHPVSWRILVVDRKQRVTGLQAPPVQRNLDLARLPLQRLVGAAVPDLDRSGAVLPLGDLAVEVEVLERVILGGGGEAVLLRRLGQALRDRPRGEHAVVLQAQVPVQAARAVLVDHEALRGGRGGSPSGWLWADAEVAFGAIALQSSGGRSGACPLAWTAGSHLALGAGPPRCGLLRGGRLGGGFPRSGFLGGRFAALARLAVAFACAHRLQARLQRAHQVGYRLGELLRGGLHGDLLALGLALDQRQHLLAVAVAVLLRFEVAGQ